MEKRPSMHYEIKGEKRHEERREERRHREKERSERNGGEYPDYPRAGGNGNEANMSEAVRSLDRQTGRGEDAPEICGYKINSKTE